MKPNFLKTEVVIAVSLMLFLFLPGFGYSGDSEVASFPSRPINFIIPVVPGSSTDLICRVLTKAAEKHLGQPVVPLNKPGASLTIGLEAVASAKPDGYTIGFSGHSPLILTPFLQEVHYDPLKDIDQIIQFADFNNFGAVVRSDSPFKTFKDVIAYARQNPKKLTLGCGLNTSGLFAWKWIARKEGGLEYTHMPFNTGILAENALLGGHVNMVLGECSISLVEAGQTRFLVFIRETPNPEYPKIPILKDLGYDIPCPSFMGVLGPKGMPEGIVKKLEESFTKAMKEPEFLKAMKELRLSIVYRNRKEMNEYVAQKHEVYRKFLKEIGVTK